MTGSERARRAFAVHEQVPFLTINDVLLDLAGVVGHIEKNWKLSPGEEVPEHAPGEVAEDFAVGQRAIDCGPHCSEITIANLGMDRCASKLAVRKLNP